MEVTRTKIHGMIREIAKLEYKHALNFLPSKVKTEEKSHLLLKKLEVDDYFTLNTSGEIFRLEILKAKLRFLRNFIILNQDHSFDFTITHNKKTIIFFEKKLLNESKFEALVELIYAHTLI